MASWISRLKKNIFAACVCMTFRARVLRIFCHLMTKNMCPLLRGTVSSYEVRWRRPPMFCNGQAHFYAVLSKIELNLEIWSRGGSVYDYPEQGRIDPWVTLPLCHLEGNIRVEFTPLEFATIKRQPPHPKRETERLTLKSIKTAHLTDNRAAIAMILLSSVSRTFNWPYSWISTR